MSADEDLPHFYENATHSLSSGEHYVLNNTDEIIFCKNLTLKEEFSNLAEKFAVNLRKSENEECGGSELYLNNGLYFKGLWSKRFEKRSIYKSKFFTADGQVTEIETMHSAGDYYYFEDKNLNAEFVELPFKGHEVSLTIILPNEGSNISELEDNLAAALTERTYKITYLKLSFPKFTIQSGIDFTDAFMEVIIKTTLLTALMLLSLF